MKYQTIRKPFMLLILPMLLALLLLPAALA